MTALLALLLFTSFEDPADVARWDTRNARLERVHDHATHGQWALKLTLLPGNYPGISLDSSQLTGWNGFDLARLDIFNPQPVPLALTVRVDDAQSANYGSRYNDDLLLRPGQNTIELSLRRLQTSDHKRNLDPARLTRFMLFGDRPATLFLDNFRLDHGSVASAWPEFKKLDPYFGLDHDWWPGKDVWQEEFLPRVSSTNEITRAEFYAKYFYLEPYRPPPNPGKFVLTLARGETATVFFNASDPVVSLPGIATELRAVRLMERPVGNSVYRIEPTALLPVTNRPHASRFALTVRVETPGLYRGAVAGIPIELRVQPFELPAPQDLPVTFGWYYGPPDDPAMRDKDLHDMADHGCNSVTAICPRPRRDGSLDMARADEFVAACRQAGLRHRLLMPSLFIAQVIGGDYAGPEFSPGFLRLFESSLRQLSPWARSHSILANPVDEPREQGLNDWNRNFADTKRFLELYRAAGIPTLVTLMGDESFGKSYVPLVPLMDVVSAHPSRSSAGIFKAARELHIYNAGMNRLSWGFYPWAIGAKGRWEWHYQWWIGGYSPFAEGTGATMPSPDGPVPTEGYERVRAGIDDYRFLMLAERRPEAQKLLEEIRGKIPRYLEGELPDEATLDEWRAKLAEFIVNH